MPLDFDSDQMTSRVKRFVKRSEANPTPIIPVASTYRPIATTGPAILTGVDSTTGRYSWVAAQYNPDGTISQQQDWGRGQKTDPSGYATEVTGCKDCIIGDVVDLFPTPDASGNYSFFYNGKARAAHVISGTQASVNGQIINVGSLVGVTPSGGEDVTIRYQLGWPGQWRWEFVKCRPAPPTCCQHGSAATLQLTISGLHKSDSWLSIFGPDDHTQGTSSYSYDASGTYTLSKNSYTSLLSCPNTTTSVGLCGWAVDLGVVGSASIWSKPETLENFDLIGVVTCGIGFNNDLTSYVMGMTIAIWGCYSGGINLGPTSPVWESFFAYAVLSPENTPSDPLDCVHLQTMNGAIGSGITLKVTT